MKRSLARKFVPLLIAALLANLGATALANPISPSVAVGSASFATAGKTLTVTNSNGTVINWQGFSIAGGETTRFVQPSAASQVLNRVTSGDPSQILGSLQSNGRVFLINPNGIAFGAGAQVNVAGLVASTLNLSDADFLAGRLNFTATTNAGKLSNAGNIQATNDGRVILVAPQVDNSGVIQAANGDVLIAAGKRVSLIDLNHPDIEFELNATTNKVVNLGRISASHIASYADIINIGGTLDASRAVSGPGGKILLKAADTTNVSGSLKATGDTGGSVQVLGDKVALLGQATIDASGRHGGGTVLVGGDTLGANPALQNARYAYVSPTATIKADALESGNGGKVVIWSDDSTRMYGRISALGGGQSGDGGFIETSGKRYLDIGNIAPSAAAPLGKPGTWLMDPYNVTIVAGNGNSNINNATPFVASGSNSQLGAGLISQALSNGTSVNISTGGVGSPGSDVGDINVSASILKNGGGAATLSLNAYRNIAISQSITATAGTLDLALNANTGGLGGSSALSSTLGLNGGTLTASGGNLTLNNGAIIQNATVSAPLVMANSATATLDGVTLNTDLAVVNNSALHLKNGLTFAGSGHSLTIGSGSSYGYLVYDNTETITGNGKIVFGAANGYYGQIYASANNGSVLTLDSGITLSGAATGSSSAAYLGANTFDAIVNKGTINADQANRTYYTYGSFTNDASGGQGVINLSAGSFNLGANTSHTWANSGAIHVAGGTLNLGGSISTANIGSISQTGGSVYLTGALNNSGSTWNLSSTGLTALNLAGTITGGTLAGTAALTVTGNSFLDGVSLNTDLTTVSTLHIKNGLTFTGSGHSLTIGSGSSYGYLVYDNTETITGNGKIVFGAANGYYGQIYASANNGSVLTLDSGITLSGAATGSSSAAYLGTNTFDAIINKGTINADQANRTFYTYGSFTNDASAGQGVIKISAGGFNLGSDINQTWGNAGSIQVSGGTLNLGGKFATANIGSVSQTGGSINLTGALNNSGSTWNLSNTGLTALNLAGTITGGTLAGTAALTVTGNSFLDGVTLNTDLSTVSTLHIKNGLTFAGSGHSLTIGGSSSYGYLLYDNTETITGNGKIIFGAANGYYGQIYASANNGSVLTLDSGITLSGAASSSSSSAYLGGNTYDAIINKGVINADQANRTFYTYGSFTNDASGGQGVINLSAGTFTLGAINSHTWTNSGAIHVSGGTLNLGGSVTTADIGSISRTGGSVNLTGILDNSGKTLDIGSGGLFGTGGLTSLTGTIRGGTLVSGDHTSLNSTNAYLDGVTVGSDLSFNTSGYLHILHGLTLGNGVALGMGASTWLFDGYTPGDAAGTVQHLATTGNATLNIANGAMYIYANNGQTLQVDAGITVQGYGTLGNWMAANTITNAGSLIANTAGQTLTVYPPNFINSGNLKVTAGTLTVNPTTFTNSGTTTVNGGTLTINAANWNNAGSLALTNGSLNLGGTVTLANLSGGHFSRSAGTSLTLSGSLNNSGNTLDIGGGGLFGTGGLNNLTGTIKGGTLVSTDHTPLTSTNAYLDGVTIGSDLSFTTSGYLHILHGLTLANGVALSMGNGTWLVDGYTPGDAAGTVQHLATLGNATVNMAGGAMYIYANNSQTLQIDAGVTLQGYGTLGNWMATNAVTNAGSLIANTAGQTFTINPPNFTNSGSLSVTAGSLNINPTNFTNSGTTTVNGGALTINAANWTNAGSLALVNGSLNLGGTVTVANLSGGHFSRSAGTSVTLSGSLDNSNNTLDIGSAGLFGTGGLNNLTGTIKGGTLVSGDHTPLTSTNAYLDGVTIGNDLSFTTSGYLHILHGLTLANGVALNLGNGYWLFDGYTSGDAAGTVQHLATPGSATVNLTGGGLYIYATNGQTLQVDADVTLQGYGTLGNWTATNAVINAGSIIANTTGQTFTINPPSFTNSGKLKATAGTLSVAPTNFTNSGTTTVNGGAVTINSANWNNSGSLTLTNGSLNLAGTVTVANLSGGHFSRSAGTSVTLSGTLDNSDNTLDIGGGGLFGTGGLNSLTGTIRGGSLVSGDHTPLVSTNAYLDGVTVGSDLAFTTSGYLHILHGLTLGNGVTLDMGASTWLFDGYTSGDAAGTVQHLASNGKATVNMANGSLYIYASNGQTLQVDAGVTVQGYGILGNWMATNAITNAGSLVANTAGTTLSITPTSFTNTGSVKVTAGTATINPINAFTNNGIVDVSTGGTLSTNSHSFTNALGGTLRGSGTYDLGYTSTYVCSPSPCHYVYTLSTLTNNGTIDPGVGVNGTGVMTLIGNLVMGSAGKLHIDLGGTGVGQYDRLAVTGIASPTVPATASLAGTLEVAEVGAAVSGGFFADKGNAFPNLLTANGGISGLSGSFGSKTVVTSAPADVSFTFAASGAPSISNTATSITRWATDNSGTWSDAANWSRGVPTTGKDVSINRYAATVVTIDSAAVTPLSLTLGNELDLVSGGTFTLPASFTTLYAPLRIAGGSLNNPNALSVAGQLLLESGSINGTGSLTLVSEGSLTKTTADSFTINQAFNNGTSANIAEGSLSLAAGGVTSGTFSVTDGATLDFAGGTHQFGDGSRFAGSGTFGHSGGTATLTGSNSGLTVDTDASLDLSVFGFTGTGILTNQGTVSGNNASFGGTLVNDGTAHLTDGRLDGGFINRGTLNVSGNLVAGGASATLADGSINLGNGATLTKDTGSLLWSGGTFAGNGTLAYTHGANFDFSGNGDRVINAPHLTFAFTDLNLPSGSLTLRAGGLAFNTTGSNATTIPTGTTLAMYGGTMTNNGPMNVSGVFELYGGTLAGSGTLNMTGGTINMPQSSTVSWTATGPLNNSGILNLSDRSISSPITNTGTINAGGGLTFTQPFSNQGGTFNLTGGTTTFSSGYTQTSGSTTLSTGSTLFGNATFSGGTLGGKGTVDGNLTIDAATLAPGFSPGTLNITGNLVLQPNSVTQIELGGTAPGTGFDFINVQGSATLGGTLNVVSWGGFTPAAGDQFQFINFGSRSGNFGQVNLNAASGLSLYFYPSNLLLAMPNAVVPSGGSLGPITTPTPSGPGDAGSPLSNLLPDSLPASRQQIGAEKIATQSAGLPTPSDISGALGVIEAPANAITLAGSAERVAALQNQEAARHEARTKLYKNAIDRIKSDPSIADVPICDQDASDDNVCLPTAERLELASRPSAAVPTQAELQAATRPVDYRVGPFPPVEPKRKIAILIGNNRYRDGLIPVLETPINDVHAVAGILKSRMGYEVKVIEDAGKKDLILALKEIAKMSTPADSVLLMYAGHGYELDAPKLAFWLPVDANADDPKTWVSNSDISKFLGLIRAKQIVLVSDSCFSGTLTTEHKIDAKGRNKQDILVRRSVVVLSSGGDEPVLDEGLENHSIFAYHLIKQLEKIPSLTSATQIHQNIRTGVLLAYPQDPQIGGVLSAGHAKGGDYLFLTQ